MKTQSNIFANIKHDIPASVVVFLIALPLCLGIALASGAPMFSGILAGIVGGLVIGSLSGSNLSVSGPAAGLTTIVLSAIKELGPYDAFLCAVVLAGAIQLLFGFLRAGVIGNFIPTCVIKGMLAAIGIILILKQIPHAVGYDADYEGDEDFIQRDGENTFTEIMNALQTFSGGATLVFIISITILILWERPFLKKVKLFQWIPAPLILVFTGIGLNLLFIHFFPEIQIRPEHLVNIPAEGGVGNFIQQLALPDFSYLTNPKVYTVGITIAFVASLESILSIEATDKLDPFKRTTPLNRELRAQGVGNMISGLIGGLPITAVIVRSSANINAGARTKLSALLHGLLLLVSVVTIPFILNLIPFSCLAAILIMTGYKLVKPSMIREMFRKGWNQFIPFIVTILAILLTNLLYGIFIGIGVGLLFLIKVNFQEAISIINNDGNYLLRLNKNVSFLNKATLRSMLERIPEGSTVIIDGGSSRFIDTDIVDCIGDFIGEAQNRNITVELKKSHSSKYELFRIN